MHVYDVSSIVHPHLALLLLESIQNAINHLLLQTCIDVRSTQISHDLLDLQVKKVLARGVCVCVCVCACAQRCRQLCMYACAHSMSINESMCIACVCMHMRKQSHRLHNHLAVRLRFILETIDQT
jgi:hypothetical protein